MTFKNFKKTLAAAAVITAVAAAPGVASAEISINTDTGVSVDTILNSGLKPETRIIYPQTGVITQSTPAPVQYNYVTRATSLPSAEASTQAAAEIVQETNTALITVDGAAPIATDDTSVILPQGNTLTKLGTNSARMNAATLNRSLAPSTTVSNLNRSADQNRILNTFGETRSMSDTIGATNTTVSSNLSTTNSLDNRSALRSGSTLNSAITTSSDTQPYTPPTSTTSSYGRSGVTGSVNSSMSGSMGGSSR